ncbi:unnamed protein product [Ceutorhynchus assimilis]|uniref:Uncharacterized protein n=1 Tax=Ceutorhynchus assimilis TaxID=467358 RepID=A0A9N9MCT6_9CUCU|nr:unnamed protein product [Ceutorhynchus assimilis]
MSDNKQVKDLSTKELLDLLKAANIEQTQEIKQELRQKIDGVVSTVAEHQSKITKLENKVLSLDRKSRRNNIAVWGLKLADNSDVLKVTLTKLNSLLGTNISEGDINNVFINKASNSAPVILEFVSNLKKRYIYSLVGKLKNSGISISHDSSFEDRQKQKVLVKHLREAKEQKLDAKIKNGKLEIGEDSYSVEELLELEKEADSDSDSSDKEQNPNSGGEVTSTPGEVSKSIKRKRRSIVYSPKKTRSTVNKD